MPVYNYSGAVLRESEGDGTSAGSGKAEQAVTNENANGFRLPTEAQWEYAARGGVPATATNWNYTYAGSNDPDDVAVHDGSKTAPVKSKTNGANSLGLYDMSGNVCEWCWDIYSATYRVYRGGSFFSYPSNCEVAYREGYGHPINRSGSIGFRVVCP
jgi:formylglycine-generating enzyme required for sulfatase activity